MDVDWGKVIVAMTAIAGIVYLEGQALAAGVNGTILAGSFALIAGLGGYVIGLKKETIKSAINALLDGDN